GNDDDAYRFVERADGRLAVQRNMPTPPGVTEKKEESWPAGGEQQSVLRQHYTLSATPVPARVLGALIRTQKYLPLAHWLLQPKLEGDGRRDWELHSVS